MPLVTYGYHYAPDLPESVEIDGVTYDRIERLPRNVRPGDLLCLGDNTDRHQYHRAFVIVTSVDTWPTTHKGWRRYPAQCQIHFKLRPADDTYRWRSWGFKNTFYDTETKEPIDYVYRARKG